MIENGVFLQSVFTPFLQPFPPRAQVNGRVLGQQVNRERLRATIALQKSLFLVLMWGEKHLRKDGGGRVWLCVCVCVCLAEDELRLWKLKPLRSLMLMLLSLRQPADTNVCVQTIAEARTRGCDGLRWTGGQTPLFLVNYFHFSSCTRLDCVCL